MDRVIKAYLVLAAGLASNPKQGRPSEFMTCMLGKI